MYYDIIAVALGRNIITKDNAKVVMGIFKFNKQANIFQTDTNIFKNGIDALFGAFIILVLPLISIISVLSIIDKAGFANYTFPIMSICLSGAYDAYGRREPGHKKNKKLIIRIIGDGVICVLSFLPLITNNSYLLLCPPIILFLIGIFIIREIKDRIYTTLRLNLWWFGW